MSSYNVMTKIHIWIGMSAKSREEFSRYFIAYPTEQQASISASQFAKDLRIRWYDDDLIGVYYNENSDALEQALDELPVHPNTIQQVQAKCTDLKIERANAMFYYEDAELEVAEPNKVYNDLLYIGKFDSM